MAEFLIKAKDAALVSMDKTGWTPTQLAKADRAYRQGDIVDVFPDGKITVEEGITANDKFWLIRVIGLPIEQARKYVEQYQVEDALGRTTLLKKRKFHIDLASLPVNVRNTLINKKVLNIQWTSVRDFLKNKVTGLPE